ncbi:hypothetical protein HYQ46_012994 [Verticillium longisporum]|nr:hypothetical protein HYQ46_012994 [Verticillium longisporum]
MEDEHGALRKSSCEVCWDDWWSWLLSKLGAYEGWRDAVGGGVARPVKLLVSRLAALAGASRLLVDGVPLVVKGVDGAELPQDHAATRPLAAVGRAVRGCRPKLLEHGDLLDEFRCGALRLNCGLLGGLGLFTAETLALDLGVDGLLKVAGAVAKNARPLGSREGDADVLTRACAAVALGTAGAIGAVATRAVHILHTNLARLLDDQRLAVTRAAQLLGALQPVRQSR